MEQPETLLFPTEIGDIYTISTSYDDFKAGIQIQQDLSTWNDLLKMWYVELLINFWYESTLNELKKLGAIEKGNAVQKYSVDDIHNSYVFIRTQVVKELGNGALSNLNEEAHRKWKQIEKQAESSS